MTVPTIEMLEWQALFALRGLVLYRRTPAIDLPLLLFHYSGQARQLRTLGYALEEPHGESWGMLIERARARLRYHLEQNLRADQLLHADLLNLILTLRHSPSDLRLARPGLGERLIHLAVSTEHCLVLTSDALPPDPPERVPVTVSARDRMLMDVTRLLTVLWAGDQLPRGHRLTPADLVEGARTIREAIRAGVEKRGLDLEQVWAGAARKQTERTAPQEQGEDVLAGFARCLDAALLAKEHRDEVWSDDGAIVLCLEQLAVCLKPPRVAVPRPEPSPSVMDRARLNPPYQAWEPLR